MKVYITTLVSQRSGVDEAPVHSTVILGVNATSIGAIQAINDHSSAVFKQQSMVTSGIDCDHLYLDRMLDDLISIYPPTVLVKALEVTTPTSNLRYTYHVHRKTMGS